MNDEPNYYQAPETELRERATPTRRPIYITAGATFSLGLGCILLSLVMLILYRIAQAIGEVGLAEGIKARDVYPLTIIILITSLLLLSGRFFLRRRGWIGLFLLVAAFGILAIVSMFDRL